MTNKLQVSSSLALMLAIAVGFALSAPAQAGDELPRRSGAVWESYPGVAISYQTVTDPAGRRIRAIVTQPSGVRGRLPTIFVAGWLSCDTVEAPPGSSDASALVFQRLAQMPGFALVRIDKPGVGDSEGDCAETDFQQELAAYRAAFRAMRTWRFVDRERIFVFGLSNGGGWAPLIAEGAPVAGYVTMGGWSRTWFEHMLDIERRRQELSGATPGEVSRLTALSARFYAGVLLEGQEPAELLRSDPAFAAIWDGPPTHLYGRPIAYYRQLQELNLAEAWSRTCAPALVLWGEHDWIMTRHDSQGIATLVNNVNPGAAQFIELPATGHTFENYPTSAAAFDGRAEPFDQGNADLLVNWFVERATELNRRRGALRRERQC